jgi:purine-nucleoside/S-methyl-5'-thioadenosine phosphorylase / adenosine deaminase
MLELITRYGVRLWTDRAALERGWLVGFTARLGGVSGAPYDTLNLAERVGDAPARVAENRRRAGAAMGFSVESLALARQVHGASVLEVARGSSGVLGEADILVARQAGPVLGILTADCAPVLVVGDRGVAIAHAGWRGLVAGAVQRAVDAVGPVASAWIGPCIHACCYEVGPEVIEAFRAEGLPVAAPDRVDPAQASLSALRRAGVGAVAVVDACTSCDRDLFSYRRDGTTGRQGAFLGLCQP